MSEQDSISRIIAGIAAAVAALTFLVAVIKNRQDAHRSREVSARAAWEKYLEMAFTHPDLALAKTDGFDPIKFEQYEWFVSRMLYAAEEVLLLTDDDRNWTQVIQDQIGFHRLYLNGRGAPFVDHYSAPLRALLKGKLQHA